MPFSGLKAMGIAPKSVDSYYGDDEAPLGWSIPASAYSEGGYSSKPIIPNYRDPVREQQNALRQMTQDYQYQRMQNELQNLPAIQSLEDIERQERMKSGLERLKMLGQKQELQNKLQQGQIDYWTPEGRRQLSQAVGMGTLSPASLQAIRAASPKSDELAEAAYNLNRARTEDELNTILEQTDKSLHLEPDFRRTLHEAQLRINRANEENDNRFIERASREEMPYEEMSKYLNPEMTRIADRPGFLKAYNEHMLMKSKLRDIVTPAWRSEDDKLRNEMVKRQTTEPNQFLIEELLRKNPSNANRDFTKLPPSPEEVSAAFQSWKMEPARMLEARNQLVQQRLNQALGREPVQQQVSPQDKQAKVNAILQQILPQ